MIIKDNLKTWVEVDRGAIKKNYDTFRSLLKPETKFMTVIKSNAYGHGLVLFAKEMENLGADFLGVDAIEEALELREEGIKIPILVFGWVHKDLYKDSAENNISLTISNFESLNNLKDYPDLKVHIEVDTNLGRQGFIKGQIPKVINFLKSINFEVEGLYTHFAIAESPSHLEFTRSQIDEFQSWVDVFREAGFSPIIHTSASAETMRSQEFNFDMVRVGIGMYGLWPSPEIKEHIGDQIGLHPVLSWKTQISEIKEVPEGGNIGYDLTETLEQDSKVAICPIGYWHGYPRHLSKRGEVSVQGKRSKVLGIVSMDMIVIDITDISEARVSNEVSLIGEGISVEELADKAGTINYEIVTRINPIIPRFYI